MIGEEFFNGEHFVWCSGFFDPNQDQILLGRQAPPSSSPKEIFHQLARDFSSKDRHSAKIAGVRAGLLDGIRRKCSNGEILPAVAHEAEGVVEQADIGEFEPLLYVIDKKAVESRLIKANAMEKATPFGSEFRIEKLRKSEFDILRFLT